MFSNRAGLQLVGADRSEQLLGRSLVDFMPLTGKILEERIAQLGRHEEALVFLGARGSGPWRRAHVALGQRALWQKHFAEARRHLEAAAEGPSTLAGEARYWAALACKGIGDGAAAERYLEQVAPIQGAGVFAGMALAEQGKMGDSRRWFEEQIRAHHPKIKVIQPAPALSVEV